MTQGNPSNARALAFLRISVGTLFLIFAQYKVLSNQFIHGGGFQYWIRLFIKEGAYPFMRPILQNFALTHAVSLAYLVTYGELAIAIALLAGVWVRVASVVGAILMLTLLFSANYPGADVPLWQYFGASLEHSVLLLCFVTLILGDASEVVSLSSSRWWRSRTVRGRLTAFGSRQSK